MANKKYAGAEVSAPMPDRDWRCEEDVRTLDRAAEVLADSARKKTALAHFKKKNRAADSLVGLFTRRRLTGRA